MESEQVAEPVKNNKTLKKHERPQYKLPGVEISDSCCICKSLCPYSKYKNAVTKEWNSLDDCTKKCCCCCKPCYKNPCCYLCCCYEEGPCECIFPRCILCPCCYCACCQTCPKCIACGWFCTNQGSACRKSPLLGLIMLPFNLADLCYNCDCCLCCLCCYSVSPESPEKQETNQPSPPNQMQDQNQQEKHSLPIKKSKVDNG